MHVYHSNCLYIYIYLLILILNNIIFIIVIDLIISIYKDFRTYDNTTKKYPNNNFFRFFFSNEHGRVNLRISSHGRSRLRANSVLYHWKCIICSTWQLGWEIVYLLFVCLYFCRDQTTTKKFHGARNFPLVFFSVNLRFRYRTAIRFVFTSCLKSIGNSGDETKRHCLLGVFGLT